MVESREQEDARTTQFDSVLGRTAHMSLNDDAPPLNKYGEILNSGRWGETHTSGKDDVALIDNSEDEKIVSTE
jgi:hypothetical protein